MLGGLGGGGVGVPPGALCWHVSQTSQQLAVKHAQIIAEAGKGASGRFVVAEPFGRMSGSRCSSLRFGFAAFVFQTRLERTQAGESSAQRLALTFDPQLLQQLRAFTPAQLQLRPPTWIPGCGSAFPVLATSGAAERARLLLASHQGEPEQRGVRFCVSACVKKNAM